MMKQDEISEYKNSVPPPVRRRPDIPVKKKILRLAIHVFAWIGLSILYYVAFSFFFDTPLEYEMKHSTQKLRKEFYALNARYDSLETVINNVIERDKNVFKTLFESSPYDLGGEFEQTSWENYEKLLTKTNKELADEFFDKLSSMEKMANKELYNIAMLEQSVDSLKTKLNYIPSIQPVINNDLTLLTASYGMRMHPFYKTLTSHQGVDFTVSEGSSVFATADGRVKDIITRRTSSGNTIILDHGNGYETTYSNLSKINVRRGQQVRRGDIIAQSGNTGLSLAPHLHYEIVYNGMRIDPIHYFFMELNYQDYQKIIKIAQSGMQSFD